MYRGVGGDLKYNVGDEFTDRGFQSTTNHKATASMFAEHGSLLHMTLPKGTKVFSPSVPSHIAGHLDPGEEFTAEPELLLKRGTRYRVTHVHGQDPSNGNRVKQVHRRSQRPHLSAIRRRNSPVIPQVKIVIKTVPRKIRDEIFLFDTPTQAHALAKDPNFEAKHPRVKGGEHGGEFASKVVGPEGEVPQTSSTS